MDKKIILASSSPRRKQILQKAGLAFSVSPANYEENLDFCEFDYAKIENCAFGKAQEVADKIKENVFVIGADTVVVNDEKILGKPKDALAAFNMLKSLSGKEHFVVTSICIIDTEKGLSKTTSVTTFVEFNKLSDLVINNYIKEFKPFDKAGAYGIQELPEGFLKGLRGDRENVIGLSSKNVIKLLNSFH